MNVQAVHVDIINHALMPSTATDANALRASLALTVIQVIRNTVAIIIVLCILCDILCRGRQINLQNLNDL
jgi:hypothetical protein